MDGSSKSKAVFIILAIIATVALAYTFYSYYNLKLDMQRMTSPEAQQAYMQKEIQVVVDKVAKHMILPQNQDPIIATIVDAEALAQEQAFYEGATDGDKLLIYSEKAILYNPVEDMIINVGPVSMEGTVVPQFVNVDIRNGSSTAGKAQNFAQSMESLGFKIVNVGNAAHSNYDTTYMVNLSGKDMSALEQQFGLTATTTLPAGEEPSEADLVMILGN